MRAGILATLIAAQPSLEDELDRFPSQEAVAQASLLIAAHESWLDSRTPKRNWNDWRACARVCNEPWLYLGIARDEKVPRSIRQMYLGNLRQAIGSEDFYRGRMPPPVPVWLFTELDTWPMN